MCKCVCSQAEWRARVRVSYRVPKASVIAPCISVYPKVALACRPTVAIERRQVVSECRPACRPGPDTPVQSVEYTDTHAYGPVYCELIRVLSTTYEALTAVAPVLSRTRAYYPLVVGTI